MRHSLLVGQRLGAIKRGSHCGEPMEHLSSLHRVWTSKNESGERPARPQHGIIILMNSFFILTEFPSYDVAQGLIGKPERKGSPNQISFSLVDTDDKDTFISFCY